MIPLRDLNPRRRFPLATILIIALNTVVFAYEYLLPPSALDAFIARWGLYAPQLMALQMGAIVRVFTAMFVHSGLLHYGGNMLYLWIFGDNIEAAMGSFRFIVFYLLCGVVAEAAEVLVQPGLNVPMIGASGAIAGVMGGYLLLYPRAEIETLVLFGFFIRLVRMPAVIVLGMWIVLQLVSGLLSAVEVASGGVAFFAHIGGFFCGMALVGVFRRRRWWE